MSNEEAKIILGITQNDIDLEKLKKIFKRQMLDWHPDIAMNRGISYQEATSKSQKIILAYEVLSENSEFIKQFSFEGNYESYYQYKTSFKKSYKHYFDHSIDDIDARFVNRITIKSSNVKWIDYVKDLEILVVKFKGSLVYYLYYNVPLYIFEKFKVADSPGRFVHQYLNKYEYDSHSKYADWLNVYKSLCDITV